jgi:periplasmic divalent cation tolerance protein
MAECRQTPSNYVQVVTTVAGREEAGRIARMLVELRLAACVQVMGPITSTYRWQGQIETAEEWQCCAKTRSDLGEEVIATIRHAHSYEVPEILILPILGGSDSYWAWLEQAVRPAASAKSSDADG